MVTLFVPSPFACLLLLLFWFGFPLIFAHDLSPVSIMCTQRVRATSRGYRAVGRGIPAALFRAATIAREPRPYPNPYRHRGRPSEAILVPLRGS